MINSSTNRRPTLTADPRPADSSLDRQGTYSQRIADAMSEARSAAAGRSMVAAVALGALLFGLLLANVLAYRYGLFS